MPLTISNRSTESDVRTWLNQNGFSGKTAKFDLLELHAIQRPGWIQVFKFCARVKNKPLENGARNSESGNHPGWQDFFGVALEDERERKQNQKTQVWLFDDQVDQQKKLDSVSADLLVCKKGQNGELLGTVLFILVVLTIAIVLVSCF